MHYVTISEARWFSGETKIFPWNGILPCVLPPHKDVGWKKKWVIKDTYKG
jgi:hypothetical protein